MHVASAVMVTIRHNITPPIAVFFCFNVTLAKILL